ncbi:MAG TPA: PepSY domain-containing protein, partial [Ideonella sp.]|nr:PepSY domain-containing protein [Ideonella sp.]
MKQPASTWAWRPALALLHRWVSLLAGLLLVLLGLTGSLMVWQAELDAALNPRWFEPRACTAPARPVAEVMAALRQHAPVARAALVVAPHTPGAAYQVWERRDPATGWRREHFIDPACGEYLGSRARGAWRLDAAHAVPLLYELHTRLLGGDTGHAVVGAGALVLLGLALSGLALAWPRRSSREAWRRALSVKAGAAPARWWLDLHRAAGLWMLPLLLLMTCTGAALVFNDTARAAVSALLPVQGLPRLPRMAPPAGPASATATAA